MYCMMYEKVNTQEHNVKELNGLESRHMGKATAGKVQCVIRCVQAYGTHGKESYDVIHAHEDETEWAMADKEGALL